MAHDEADLRRSKGRGAPMLSGSSLPRLLRPAAMLSGVFAALFCGMLAAAGSATTAAAQSDSSNLYAIVARVGTTGITGFEVLERAKVLQFLAGRSLNDAEKQALDSLVEDAVKSEEGARIGVTVSDAEVEEAFGNLAQNNNMSDEAFARTMSRAEVRPDAMKEKIRADLLWNRLLRRRFGERLQPTEEEIVAFIDSAPAEGPRQYDIALLIVPLAANASRAQVDAIGPVVNRTRARMTNCSRIQEISREYARGSGRGVLPAERMPGPIRDAVLNLRPGEVADPIRSRTGVNLIMLCGVREPQAPTREQALRTLQEERASRFAGSYLEELRSVAIIE